MNVLQGSIRGGIGNLLNMCSSSSSTDIAIITDDGVYIYDNKDALLTGACLGPLTLTSIFNGYSGSGALPSISDIIGLMVYQNNDIDMYNNFQVWRWQVQSGNLWSQSAQSFPKPMENLLGVSTGDLPPSNSDWCVNRDRNGRQDRFFYNGGLLYYFSTQNPTQDTFTPSATDKYMNGYNLNPWTNLPAEPLVAVFSITSDSDDFVMITQSGELYQYQMDHVTNSNNPPITSTHLGTLVF
ncbi:uncharacterized protein [Argopecten irradians]|uniref:uncharacterized protein n=1 Tax=Argopecten irradians TaxID=31199 RepID=UPI00371265B1